MATSSMPDAELAPPARRTRQTDAWTLALLKWRPSLAYDVAPWLGRYAAVAFAVIWVTSVLAYYTDFM